MLISRISKCTMSVCLLSGPSSQHSLHHTNMQRKDWRVRWGGRYAWVTKCPPQLKETEGGGEGGGAWTVKGNLARKEDTGKNKMTYLGSLSVVWNLNQFKILYTHLSELNNVKQGEVLVCDV